MASDSQLTREMAGCIKMLQKCNEYSKYADYLLSPVFQHIFMIAMDSNTGFKGFLTAHTGGRPPV